VISRLEIKFALKKWALLRLFIVFVLIWPVGIASAQQTQADGPVYVVQSGDSLWDIAQRFHVSLDDLQQANGITNPNQLSEGAQLIIPGLEGIQGELVTKDVPYGENLRSLSRRYQVPEQALERLNHLSSPSEIYAGYTLVLPDTQKPELSGGRAMLSPGQSLLELAVLNNTDPWGIVAGNNLTSTVTALPGDSLFMPGDTTEGPGALPGEISAVQLNPSPLLQGKAFSLKLATNTDLSLSGKLGDYTLHFFPDGSDGFVALQGINALAEPGLYPLQLQGSLPDGTAFIFSQLVPVYQVDYPYDTPLTVDPSTIDPAVTQPEDQQWAALTATATPERMWHGVFRIPSPLDQKYCLETNDCWSSRFGNRRSYNGSPYKYFHTGLDIVGTTGTEIYAPAPGIVVFAGPLTVRGNATVIDHGWGVYTAYLHQSEFKVKVGDRVQAGQLIGLVGGTGRVEGPHLHWEVIVGGVQVDPLDWLKQAYP
jgi:murein DD-endopeptidase MepM/ murein hydrolase activator NlpD